MADLKISELTAITTLDGTEEFVVADSGTTKKITAANALSGGGLYDAYAKLSDVKSTGTAGGSASATTWNIRTLNTEDHDAAGIVSLSSNQFTLQAGSYHIRAVAPAHNVAQQKLRLRNVTDSTNPIIGTNNYNTTVTNIAELEGDITIASAKAFEIQHYTAGAQASNGLGPETNATGISEVYCVVHIWRYA